MNNNEITVNVKYNTKDDMVKFGDKLIPSGVEYELVSSKNQKISVVEFEKDVPVKVSGLLAELCLKAGKGTVKMYDPNEIKVKQEKKEIEELKEKVSELLSEKKIKEQKVSEPKKDLKK